MKKYTKKDIEDMKEEIFENLCGTYIWDDGLHPNDIEDMKEEIFENLCGAYIDDGLHPNDAEELAKEELDELTDTAIVKMFLKMNS